MNKGKICVSMCAETAGELIDTIRRAGDLADIIELRFDCLENQEVEKVIFELNKLPEKSKRLFLATFRPPEQGGNKKLLTNYHIDFWLNSNVDKVAQWADFEFDLDITRFNLCFQKEIRSFHLFSRKLLIHSPEFLTDFYEKLKTEYSKGIFKIAVQADDITDSLDVWRLLKKAKSENKQLIPIAMGEAGKWTRILGLAHGAPITYASLETGKETAAGQITAREMIDVYRVKELSEQTAVYGIVGNPVNHSLSPLMQNAAFKLSKLDAVYIPLEVANLDAFIKRMVKPETRELDWNLKGFSVTIPHKQTIIKYLDEIDKTAQKIGAVNTVKIENGKLFGYNTDADGFIEPLKAAYGDLQNARVAVLGSGGAARAVVYALKNEGATVIVSARNIAKSKLLAEEFNVQTKQLAVQNTAFTDYDIVVNTTPLGTKGELEHQTPAIASQIKDIKLIYDLNYNPFETAFIKEAKKAGVPTIGGLAMLVAQGAKQFKIWTGKAAPVSEMSQAAFRKMQN